MSASQEAPNPAPLDPPRGPWTALGFGALILSSWGAGIMIVIVALYRTAKLSNPDLDFWTGHLIGMFQNPIGMTQASVVGHMTGILMILLCARWMRAGPAGEFLCLRPVERSVLLRWLVLAAGFRVAWDAAVFFGGGPDFPRLFIQIWRTPHLREITILHVLISAPIFEELFFRGFLFRGLETSPLGTHGTIVATATGFGAMHLDYHPVEIAVVVIFGLLMGVARARTGSVLVPMAMHIFGNSALILGAALLL